MVAHELSRPIAPDLHPIATGNYRIATPAIQELHELVMRCLRYRTTGALIYGASRIGKTRVIEYVLLAPTPNCPMCRRATDPTPIDVGPARTLVREESAGSVISRHMGQFDAGANSRAR
jgi:hypothetical protein